MGHRSTGNKPLLWAFLLAFLFHVGLFFYHRLGNHHLLLSSNHFPPVNEYFIEINPLAPEVVPEADTPFFSFKNQVSAQSIIEDVLPPSIIPTQAEGDESAHKVIQAQEALPAMVMHESLPADDPTSVAEDGIGEASPHEPTEKTYPKPRPRPSIQVPVIEGPLKQAVGSVHRVGLAAVDARFTEYGSYLQCLLEAISTQWHMSCRSSSRILADRGTYVAIVFQINAEGSIEQLQIEASTATDIGISLCKNAILSRSPFGKWTEDMRLQLGDFQKISIHFSYY
jgi:hypothetical protein